MQWLQSNKYLKTFVAHANWNVDDLNNNSWRGESSECCTSNLKTVFIFLCFKKNLNCQGSWIKFKYFELATAIYRNSHPKTHQITSGLMKRNDLKGIFEHYILNLTMDTSLMSKCNKNVWREKDWKTYLTKERCYSSLLHF